MKKLLILALVTTLFLSANSAQAQSEWIWLTRIGSGQPIIVNLSQVFYMEERYDGGTELYQSNEFQSQGMASFQTDPLSVQESIEQILDKLAELKAP